MQLRDPMFRGNIQTQAIDQWTVTWESLDDHRFWCLQEIPTNSKVVAVVMLNPGSLNGTGENLRRDTTLRVLRRLFKGTGYNPFVVNLFSLATPNPAVLFDQWARRDHPTFDYRGLPLHRFLAVLYAYGDYENGDYHREEIKCRIADVKNAFSAIPEIGAPRNQSGTPKHPLSIQRQRRVSEFRNTILEHAARSDR